MAKSLGNSLADPATWIDAWRRADGKAAGPDGTRGQMPVPLTDLLTRTGGTKETQRSARNRPGLGVLASEIRRHPRDMTDVYRMNDNPEAAGSNPVPPPVLPRERLIPCGQGHFVHSAL